MWRLRKGIGEKNWQNALLQNQSTKCVEPCVSLRAYVVRKPRHERWIHLRRCLASRIFTRDSGSLCHYDPPVTWRLPPRVPQHWHIRHSDDGFFPRQRSNLVFRSAKHVCIFRAKKTNHRQLCSSREFVSPVILTWTFSLMSYAKLAASASPCTACSSPFVYLLYFIYLWHSFPFAPRAWRITAGSDVAVHVRTVATVALKKEYCVTSVKIQIKNT